MAQDKNKNIYIVLGVIVFAILIWFFFIRKNSSFNKDDYTYLVNYLKNNIGFTLRKINLANIARSVPTTTADQNRFKNILGIADNNIRYSFRAYDYEERTINKGDTANMFGDITDQKVFYNVKTKGNTGVFIIDQDGYLVDKNKNVILFTAEETANLAIPMILKFKDKKTNTLLFDISIPAENIIYELEELGEIYRNQFGGLMGTQIFNWRI
jgi:hypothetical protein